MIRPVCRAWQVSLFRREKCRISRSVGGISACLAYYPQRLVYPTCVARLNNAAASDATELCIVGSRRISRLCSSGINVNSKVAMRNDQSLLLLPSVTIYKLMDGSARQLLPTDGDGKKGRRPSCRSLRGAPRRQCRANSVNVPGRVRRSCCGHSSIPAGAMTARAPPHLRSLARPPL